MLPCENDHISGDACCTIGMVWHGMRFAVEWTTLIRPAGVTVSCMLRKQTEAMEAKTAELSEKELKQRVKMQEEVDKLRAFAHAHDDEVEEDGSNHEMSKSEKKAEDKANKMQEEIFKKFGDVSDGPRKLKPWESAPRALVGGTVGKLLGGAKQLTLTMTGLGGDLLLEGDLLKLGGRKKDKWEKRHLKCSTEGLVW